MVKQVSPQGLQWFQDARFGLFIHWGLYSILAKEEWIMHLEQIPVMEYEQLLAQFNPLQFNAADWVSIAADAGQKYIIITSRHHDGFSMYDTALSDYKVTNTPFRRDPLAELANVCARRGDIKLGFYVSLLDWHHPAYRFRYESRLAWSDYLDFLHGQVRELCTQFGEIVCIWLDGDWPRAPLTEKTAYFAPGGSFEYATLYDRIHTLQPNAIVLNNRHDKPLPGEDAQGFEQDLPGMNSAGFNTTAVSARPLEVCMTINDHWGYSHKDRNHKSARQLIHTLARCASLGANLLLNVGPTPQGEILPIQVKRLQAVGHWLQVNGAAIYGTRAGIIPPTSETVSTRRGDSHYIHILEDTSDYVTLRGVPETITAAGLLRDGASLVLERQDDTTTTLLVPAEIRDPPDTVILLT